MSADRTESYPTLRRRQSQREEAREQTKLNVMLGNLLDPNCTFWTALENQPRSARAGMLQKRRGCRSGMPDVYVVYRGKPIHIELKSRIGTVSKAQRQARLELLRSGAQWMMARSARGAVKALYLAGVRFRSCHGRRWRPPELPAWEEPRSDPSVPHPAHPALTAIRREAKRRQRAAARQRSQLQHASQPSAQSPAWSTPR
jgi:hypothetical protein